MNARRILCWLGRHDFTAWSPIGTCEDESDHIHHYRRCRRCPKRQQTIRYKDDGSTLDL